MGSTLSIALGFLAVMAVAAWALKRWRRVAPTGPLAQARVLHVLGLGPRERVVTVEIDGGAGERCRLVLGVTPQAIHTLHVMQPGARADFASDLRSAEAATAAAPTPVPRMDSVNDDGPWRDADGAWREA